MKKISVDDYLEEVKVFKEVTPERADRLLANEQGITVYIGLKDCPYCRKFVHTLSPLAKEKDLEVYYVNAKDEKHEEEIKEFREKYNLKTVPGLLYSSETAGLVVKTDSSLSEAEIMRLIEAE